MSDVHEVIHSYNPTDKEGPESVLLVWDAPNLDMGLGAILGGRPTAAYRPRFDAIGRWLLARAGRRAHELGRHIEPEATVFANITPGGSDVVRPWVEALRNVGFAVFAKPKIGEDSDVDPDMIDHIRRRYEEGVLRGVIVASADGQHFRETLEHASWAVAHDTIEFVDLEEIPGVFREPLPRVSLDNLPDGGAWLQPFRPLTALLSNRHNSQE